MELEDQEKEIQLCKEPIIYGGGGAVDSVNGYTGDVVLTTSDLENTSDYQNSTEVQALIDSSIADKQDKLTAGDNVSIENNVISATDTTYTAGTGIEITSGNVINATGTSTTAWGDITGTLSDQTDLKNALDSKQDVLMAGDAITIDENNVISADIVPADYFTASETVTGSNSTFTLDNTIDAKLKNVEVLGDTEQQTYTGKNLCTSATIAGANTLVFYCAPNNLFTNKTITISVISDSTVSQAIVYIYNGDTSLGEIGRMDLTADQKSSATITLADDIYTAFIGGADGNIRIYKTNSGHDISKTLGEPMIELGSASTSYEPYVGGTASPNPSFPQDVNVVTGEQIVTIMGKNLFNPNTTTANKRLDGSGLLISDNSYMTSDYIRVKPSTTYTYSRYTSGGGSCAVCFYKEDKTFILRDSSWMGTTPATKTSLSCTTTADTSFVRICDFKTLTTLQVESGDKSSTYEPYQSQSYTVDLGSIELCKIGTYQDYIYKSGDDWYVHKETNKDVFDGSETWSLRTGNTHTFQSLLSDTSEGTLQYCNYFTHMTSSSFDTVDGCYASNSSTLTITYLDCPSVSDFKTWLSTHNVAFYYPIATSTDTKITDSTLISQLNALYNGRSYDEQTNFVVIATNLPAILSVEAYRKSLDGTIGSINSIVDTNTTYSDFVGTDGVNAGTSGLVPAPATTDAGKFLKADGTWATAGGGGTAENVHEITVDDYNWNKTLGSATEPYDTVAMWLLEPGWYSKADGSTVSLTRHANPGGIETISNGIFFVGETLGTSTNARVPYLFAYSGDKTHWYQGFIRPDIGWEYDIGKLLSDSDISVVQTMGNSQTNVMSQNATTSMIFADPATKTQVQIGSGASNLGSGVAIGSGAAITSASYYRAIALGSEAKANATGSVAIGAYSSATATGEFNIGTTQTSNGYNSSNYRLLSGVYDAQGDHDAVNLSQLNGRVKTNAGAPTTATVGTVGQLLEDITNGKLYQCTAIDTTDPNNPSYTWSEVGAGGGGGGPTVVQTAGTSQTDVMSQNAVSSMVFADPGTNQKVRIGANTSGDWTESVIIGAAAAGYATNCTIVGASAAGRGNSVAIGKNAKAGNASIHNSTVAVGYNAQALAAGAIALGRDSQANSAGEMNIGTSNTSWGYSSSNYRLLSGLYDGQNSHDAVTVGQVNGVIDAINTALNTSIPHIGA